MTSTACLLSDHELVSRAQRGDAEALDLLITAVRPAVLKYCRSRLATYAGGFDAADDVAQETCVGLMRVLPRYTNRGAPFAAFVYAIAANKVADFQRTFRRAAVLVEEVPEQVELSPTPEDQLITALDVNRARALLGQLPERMREVLLLRAGGISAEAVGERMGMTANAVRVAQHRAGIKLRQLIAETEDDEGLFDSAAWARRHDGLRLAS